MKLTKDQKVAVARIIEGSVANANHGLVHSRSDEEREHYRKLMADAEAVLPLFKGRETVTVEEDEEEEDHA